MLDRPMLLSTLRSESMELAARSSLALDAVNIALGPRLDVGRIRFVGVDVHSQRKIRSHANQHVAKDQLPVARDSNAHNGLVANSVAEGIGRRHVNMSQCANDTAVDL